MRFLSELGTDEYYVEAVRRWLANREGSSRRYLGTCLLLPAMAVALPLLIAKGYERAAVRDGVSWQMLSFFLAQRAGFQLALAAFSLRWAVRIFRGPRLERLVVRYHDALSSENRAAAKSTENAACTWPAFAEGSFKSRLSKWLWRGDFALKAQTDHECIELARRFLKQQKRLTSFLLAVGIICVLICLVWLRFATSDMFKLSGSTPWKALAVGLASGLLEGLLIYTWVEQFTEALQNHRNPRLAQLMLKFHDAAASQMQPDEP